MDYGGEGYGVCFRRKSHVYSYDVPYYPYHNINFLLY